MNLYSDGETLIRFAGKKDIPLLLEFIRGLAEYEQLLDQVEATAENLGRFIFREKKAQALILESLGSPAGFAIFFYNFSSFLGRPGIYIEDIFVKPRFRGRGFGRLILRVIAGIAVEKDCGRLEWACLDWNEPSIGFYKSQGAKPLAEWTTYRVTGEKLKALSL